MSSQWHVQFENNGRQRWTNLDESYTKVIEINLIFWVTFISKAEDSNFFFFHKISGVLDEVAECWKWSTNLSVHWLSITLYNKYFTKLIQN